MNKFSDINKLFWFFVGIILGILLTKAWQDEIFVAKDLQDKKIDTTFVLSKDKVLDLCIECGIEAPEIVLKQAILETGHFTSNVCLKKKNLFGFFNGRRYLEFESYKECIEFYKSWQDKKYKGGNYYTFLQCLPYAEDSNYVCKLKKIK